MYYIIELAGGKQFIYTEKLIIDEENASYSFDRNLPPDCVGFTIVDPERLDEDGFPYNFHVSMGTKRSTIDGIDYYYHNGNVMQYDDKSTKIVRSYEDLNNEFQSARISYAIFTR